MEWQINSTDQSLFIEWFQCSQSLSVETTDVTNEKFYWMLTYQYVEVVKKWPPFCRKHFQTKFSWLKIAILSNKPALVQIMAYCPKQITSHYLNGWCPTSVMLLCVTWHQCINEFRTPLIETHFQLHCNSNLLNLVFPRKSKMWSWEVETWAATSNQCCHTLTGMRLHPYTSNGTCKHITLFSFLLVSWHLHL